MRAPALLSLGWFMSEFLATGLSGGDSSEMGVSFVSPVERSSESSAYLSKMGSFLWLSGDSAMVAGCELLPLLGTEAGSIKSCPTTFCQSAKAYTQFKGNNFCRTETLMTTRARVENGTFPKYRKSRRVGREAVIYKRT